MNENCLEVSLVEELLWKRASCCVFAGVNESGSHLLQIVKQVGWLAVYLPVFNARRHEPSIWACISF